MHLLLVRHAESVDNVAGLYAGSRDSPLTNHGVLQAKRLGDHLVARRDAVGPITRIFASDLQRAYRTAEAVADAQRGLATPGTEQACALPSVTQVPELREKDFGSSEGKRFGSKPSGKASTMARSDAETRDAMTIRVDRFIHAYLAPLLDQDPTAKSSILVVSHGIILNVLLGRLLSQFPAPAHSAAPFGPIGSGSGSECIATWSNTGCLQALVDVSKAPASGSRSFDILVQFTNNVDHLNGLKKTRGGIGSAKFDARQRTMDSFFTTTAKKRKAEEQDLDGDSSQSKR